MTNYWVSHVIKEDAISTLMALGGRQHQVMTAVALVQGDKVVCDVVTTTVTFRTISEQEALNYWYSGEPKDKAGGYGIQGLGAQFVEKNQWLLLCCCWFAINEDTTATNYAIIYTEISDVEKTLSEYLCHKNRIKKNIAAELLINVTPSETRVALVEDGTFTGSTY